MTTTQPVCVTGASGYIAAHLIRELLGAGYKVHGTVRSLDKPGKVDHLTSLEGAAEGLKLFEAQLLDEGSYDSAIEGCEVVMHTASPYAINVDDPQRDLVDPAVKGTLNVLHSCGRLGVKKVVLTSSMAAVTDEPESDKILSEADWNEKSSLTRNPYFYSKTMAERAAWKYVEASSPGFDLVVINPFLVIGPSLGPSLNTSNAILKDLLCGVYPGVMSLTWGFVDVRDVARAHVMAMEKVGAEGRYVCANVTVPMSEVVAMLKEKGYGKGRKLPRFSMASGVGDVIVKMMSYTQPKGTGTYLRSHVGKMLRFDNSKIKRDLGVEFIPIEQTITDTIEDLLKWSHLAPVP